MEQGEIGNIKVKQKHRTWEFFTSLIWGVGVLRWVGRRMLDIPHKCKICPAFGLNLSLQISTLNTFVCIWTEQKIYLSCIYIIFVHICLQSECIIIPFIVRTNVLFVLRSNVDKCDKYHIWFIFRPHLSCFKSIFSPSVISIKQNFQSWNSLEINWIFYMIVNRNGKRNR